MSDRIIVSRHLAAIEFIARELAGGSSNRRPMVSWSRDTDGSVRIHEDCSYGYSIPVLASATADDVRGKIVYGTLPLHLAALAAEVVAIEFDVTTEAGCRSSLAAKMVERYTGTERSVPSRSESEDYYLRTGADLTTDRTSWMTEDAQQLKKWMSMLPTSLAEMNAAGARLTRYVVTAK